MARNICIAAARVAELVGAENEWENIFHVGIHCRNIIYVRPVTQSQKYRPRKKVLRGRKVTKLGTAHVVKC